MNAVASLALDRVVEGGAIVPALWRWEVQEVARRLEAAGKLTKTAADLRAELRELPIVVDAELTSLFGNEAATGKQFALSVYDAAYLELAIRLHVPLATNDRALLKAGKAAKLPVLR